MALKNIHNTNFFHIKKKYFAKGKQKLFEKRINK